MVSVSEDRVSFRLEDGRTLALGRNDPQLRHLDHAWASTVHAFQGRTVDNVIAAMEADHPHLTTQKSLYVEISRARDRAELVTDDAVRLREWLETATGERISALEGIASPPREAPAKGADAVGDTTVTTPERDKRPAPEAERDGADAVRRVREPAAPVREMAVELELEL